MNLPNALTVLRIFLVPFLVVVLLSPPWVFGANQEQDAATSREVLGVAIFLIAMLSDWLDGFLARRRNQITTLGTLLDPIADKLLTSAAFISLVEMGLAPAWMVVIIIGREFIVSGLRSILATRGFALPASAWGKLKTISQAVAIVLLILTASLDRWGQYGWLGVSALWVSMFLALVSGGEYMVRFMRVLPEMTAEDERNRQSTTSTDPQ